MRAAQIYAALQRQAHDTGRATAELLTLYGLERFLARLSSTTYHDDLVLKGGVLLAAYRLRRPTRDIDLQAMDSALDEEHLRAMLAAVVAQDADDGLVMDLDRVTVEPIRDDEEYTGLRVTVPVTIHTYLLNLKLDVSTGDPIWPAPEEINLPALLGGTVSVLGHPLPTVIAEKSVTILQRGTTSTRWRDFVDLGGLARTQRFVAGDLRAAAKAVARYRQIALRPIAPAIIGYPEIAQPKWAAWLGKNQLYDAAEALFADQLALITAFIDPVYSGEQPDSAEWDPEVRSWRSP